jgi:5-methylcytosine-specific restriction endonuclease McrA
MSCAAKYNNPYKTKRVKTKTCKTCGSLIYSNRTYCKTCFEAKIFNGVIGELRKRAPLRVNHDLRGKARTIYANSGRPRVCQRCGYDKYVEICHLIGISTFPDDTPIAVINDLDNLVALCPNCHWELDHGLLHPDEIPRIEGLGKEDALLRVPTIWR